MPAKRETVERIAKKLQGTKKLLEHETLLQQLAETGHPAAVPHIVKYLTNPQPIVSEAAAEALAKMGKTAMPEIKKAVKSNISFVRENMAWALRPEIFKNKEAVPLLLGMVNDDSWEIRRNAIASLGQHRDLRALPALTKALEDPQSLVGETAASFTYWVIRNLGKKEQENKIVNALSLVHSHLRAEDDAKIMRKAYLAALKGKVTKENARLFVKQLRAVKGNVK